jgi:CBS domain-containing protein
MHRVSDLLRVKGQTIHTISPEMTALAAAQKMNDLHIGSLVVTEGQRLAGIITERDMLTRIVAGERPPSRTLVEHVMTRSVVSCGLDTVLGDVRGLMRERRIRHVPVVDEGRLVGMVSIGDLNAAETRTLSETITYLENYISG